MSRAHSRSAAIAACALALGAGTAAAQSTPQSLKDAFKDAFMIGAAVNANQFGGRDERGAELIRAQFNTISPENALKWESVHPRPGVYDFAQADRYVDFGTTNGMFVIGHTLVWHNQTPRWVFQDASGHPVSRDTLLARMRDHIFTVMGRYKGRVKGWDVVNEAVDDDGSLRRSPWYNIIGPDFIEKAYQFAHEADPSAELYYNDYSVENAPKRAGVVRLIRQLQADGIHIAAVGLQGHDRLDWPTIPQEDSTINELAALGVKVNVTELDVDVLPRAQRGTSAEVTLQGETRSGVNPYASGLPDSVQQALAARYGELFTEFLRHRDVMDRVTFWGVGDGDSWLNNWPLRGRTSYPLAFDRGDKPKPAFEAIIRAALRRPVM